MEDFEVDRNCKTIKIYIYLCQEYGPIYLWGTFALISNYFWFMMGNRTSFSAVSLLPAYVGFREYNIVISGTLIYLNMV
jgi:hypothetical protein